MNYLQEILSFEKLQEINLVSPGQARLWYVLMYINNLTGWKTWFTVASSTLEFRSGLSRSGVIKARNELKQLGYIDFQTNGRKATSYRMISLTQDSTQVGAQPSVQGSTQVSVQSSAHTSTQDGVQGSTQVGTPLYKQNKTQTKQNKTKENTPLTPQRGESRPRPAKSVPGEVAEIVAYLNKVTGTDYKPTTKKTQQLIKARMRDGFTVADFKTVIDKKNQDEWFVTGGYMRPETLFGTKFEGYLNERPKNQSQQPAQRIYGMNM